MQNKPEPCSRHRSCRRGGGGLICWTGVGVRARWAAWCGRWRRQSGTGCDWPPAPSLLSDPRPATSPALAENKQLNEEKCETKIVICEIISKK